MSEKFKPYNLEEARNEAVKITEKIKSGEAKDYSEAEKLAEKEEKKEIILTPEIVEEIMDKLEDINEKGMAFSVVVKNSKDTQIDYLEKIKNILQNGLLGVQPEQENWEDKYFGDTSYSNGRFITPENWSKSVREDRKSLIHFNIVGRSYEEQLNDHDKFVIKESHFMAENNVAIIFDIKHLKEGRPSNSHDLKEEEQYKTGTFHCDDQKLYELLERFFGDSIPNSGNEKLKINSLKNRLEDYEYNYFDKNGTLHPSSEYGFTLLGRIAPRFIKGIVFNSPPKMTSDEIKKSIENEINKEKIFLYKNKDGIYENVNDINELRKKIKHENFYLYTKASSEINEKIKEDFNNLWEYLFKHPNPDGSIEEVDVKTEEKKLRQKYYFIYEKTEREINQKVEDYIKNIENTYKINSEGKLGKIIEPEKLEKMTKNLYEKYSTEQGLIQKRAEEIISVMLKAYREGKGVLAPIYDTYGNLWWPKHMDYEELKKITGNKTNNENI